MDALVEWAEASHSMSHGDFQVLARFVTLPIQQRLRVLELPGRAPAPCTKRVLPAGIMRRLEKMADALCVDLKVQAVEASTGTAAEATTEV